MWHEARKQEKKIRGMMVDYKRRAERRREYYEKIKQDPAQFLQVHGRPARIHLDPAVAIAADSPATMMPWQGHSENLIDRFDVRAHLDIIPDYKTPTELPKLSGEELVEDRKACYERYRTLVQNDFLGVNEDKFLYQIFLEERFGPVLKPGYEDEKKKSSNAKAAIGYVYEDSTFDPLPFENSLSKVEQNDDDDENEDEKEEDLSDIDLDVTVDVSVLNPPQCAEMNAQSIKYGMVDDDFITYLMNDKDEAEQLKLAREIEEEKAMFSGRKSRRERRALREKKLAGRKITSPPSYAARDSPTYTPMRQHSTSKSRSRSPPNAGKVMFITSFGGEGSDGELGLKSGDKVPSSNSKHEKTSKSKDNSSAVIGPQLPSKNGEDQSRNSGKSKRIRNSSSSSKSTSSSRERRDKRSSYRKRYKSKRSKRSRSASSSSSSSRRSRSKHKRSRRSSSRSSSRRSRSTSYSRVKSRSHTQSHQRKSRSRSRSKSKSKISHEKSNSPSLPPPPVKSYYRHSLSKSNSDLSEDSDDSKSTRSLQNVSGTSKSLLLLGKAGPATKTRITPQERLKRKMQLALKKQYKADKKAQMEKTEKQLQEKQDREEELREMAIKLRQRERERRHRIRGYGADSDSDSTWTRNPDHGIHSTESHSSRKDKHNGSRSDSSSSSSSDRSPKPSSKSRYRSRSKSPLLPKPPTRRYLLERPRTPPYKQVRNSPSRHSPRRSPRRSPQRSHRRSPVRSSHSSRDSRHTSPNKYSPSRSSPRRYSSNSRHNSSRQDSYSPPRSKTLAIKSKPLVDY